LLFTASLASAELSTSYGGEATLAASSVFGLSALNAVIMAIVVY
jgi:hypothetical protein